MKHEGGGRGKEIGQNKNRRILHQNRGKRPPFSDYKLIKKNRFAPPSASLIAGGKMNLRGGRGGGMNDVHSIYP